MSQTVGKIIFEAQGRTFSRPMVAESDLTRSEKLARLKKQYQSAMGQETSAIGQLFEILEDMDRRLALVEGR